MYFIRPCPSCGRKVRFPIDKGKIKVKCSCGYSFVADPDDPSLFKEGNFDLRGGDGKEKKRKKFLEKVSALTDLRKIKRDLITSLYDYRYSLQNFTLLPDVEKRRIIMKTILVIIVVLFLLYLVFYSTSYPRISEDII